MRRLLLHVGLGSVVSSLLGACLSRSDSEPGHGSSETTREATEAICPVGPAFPGCYGECGHLSCSPIDPGACCACDDGCVSRGDCCCDYELRCVSPPADDSCEGRCGGSAPAGCFCDLACSGFGDCCGDFAAECLSWAKVFPLGSAREQALAADPSENVFLSARVSQTWDAGGGPIGTTINDSLVVSWNKIGGFRWASRLTSDGGTVSVRAMAHVGSRLYAVGQYTGANLKHTGGVWLSRPPGASSQAFLLALNPATGAALWARSPSSAYLRGSLNDVTRDSANRAVAAGELGVATGLGKFLSYDSAGTLSWLRPASTLPPLLRITLDSSNRSYVLDSGSPDQIIRSYSAAGALRFSAPYINQGRFNDVVAVPNRLFAVGRCYEGCVAGGRAIDAGLAITSFSLDTGAIILRYIDLFEGQWVRADAESTGNVVTLGEGRRDGVSQAFLRKTHWGGVTVSEQILATAPFASLLESRDLALANGLTRYASVSANAPIAALGESFDTAASWNGLLIRVP